MNGGINNSGEELGVRLFSFDKEKYSWGVQQDIHDQLKKPSPINPTVITLYGGNTCPTFQFGIIPRPPRDTVLNGFFAQDVGEGSYFVPLPSSKGCVEIMTEAGRGNHITDQILSTFKFTSSLGIILPNEGVYRITDSIAVSWNPYVGDFEKYELHIGNQIVGGSQQATLTIAKLSKTQTSFTINNLSDIVNKIGGKAPELVQDSYYIKIVATASNGAIVAQTRSNPFSITK